MSTYRASVIVGDGMLTVRRPLTAPDRIVDMIDTLAYAARDAAPDDQLSVEFAVQTGDVSDTPLGDSVLATSSAPLALGADVDGEDDDAPAVPSPAAAGQQ